MEGIGDDVIINSGMHQFQHGRIQAIETATEIPFAHVLLRTKGGRPVESRPRRLCSAEILPSHRQRNDCSNCCGAQSCHEAKA